MNGFKHQDFKETYNNAGRPCELMVINYLLSLEYLVEDLQNDTEKQKRGYDIIVNEKIKIEIKQDWKINNGNFFGEWTIDRTDYIEMGWMQHTEADYLFYYDAVNTIYVIDMQQFILELKKNGKFIHFKNNKDKCDATGYIIPINKAKKLGLVKSVIHLDKAANKGGFFVAQKQVETV